MREDRAAALREGLEGFAAKVVASLPRTDQRGKSSLYLRGLMLAGQRNSLQPMAAPEAWAI